MTVLFICAGLEPGRDGVGDYTRLLAAACIARGHSCTLLALQDRHVDSRQDETSDGLRVIRLPAATPWPERLTYALDRVQHIAADWVSWQFVAYGFHPRGFLPSALLQAAAKLRGARCHIMLHELWIGLEVGASLRNRALGWLQRRGIVCLLDQLDADVVHTSNPTYRAALLREGCDCEVLPLFGNVPIAPAAPAASALLVGITFGTLHPQWRPAATAEWLLATAHRQGRTAALIVVGRAGAHAPGLLNVFRDQGITVTETGELTQEAASRLFTAADFGIAPHPWALIGKSGAAAALLEHGLPVVVPRDDWQLRGIALTEPAHTDPLLVRLAELDAVATDHWLANRRAPASILPRTTDAFLQTLATTP